MNSLVLGLVDPLLSAPGIHIGTATVMMDTVTIGQPRIVSTAVPGTNVTPSRLKRWRPHCAVLTSARLCLPVVRPKLPVIDCVPPLPSAPLERASWRDRRRQYG